MDIKNLVTFINVAELNSFTKAAEVMGYSQSTVSFQIKQLEKELNSQLFDRINHTIMLTQRGREVLKYAQEIGRLTEELQDSMQEQKMIRGYVRLAMSDSLCEEFFDEYGEFWEKYPEISLKIVTAGTEEMFRLIDHNESDMILTLDQHIYNADYVIVQEEQLGTHFVVSKNSPLAEIGRLTVQELMQYPFILTEKGMSYRRLMDEKLAGMSMEIQPILEIGNTKMICSLVKREMGLSFLPDFVTEDDVQNGDMIRLDVEDFEIGIWKQLLYHRGKWISPAMQTVLDYTAHLTFHK